MARPEYHVFVCAQTRPAGHPRGSCGEKGAGKLLDAFSQGLISRNLLGKVALTNTGCIGPCQAGANVLVYPGSVLYMNVQPEEVNQIIEQHLIGGEPVQSLCAPAEVW